jgi:hypothetical protein
MMEAPGELVPTLQFGEIVEVQVTGIAGYGAFVVTDRGHRGLVHLSELTDEWVPFGQVGDYLAEGERLQVKVVKANPEGYGFSAHGVTRLARHGAAPDPGAGAEAAAARAGATSVDLWLRYLTEVSRHLFATPAAQERLRQLAEEAGTFALGVAMGNRVTTAAMEALVLRELRAALGLRQVEATDHAIDRWLEKVDPTVSREEARQAIARAGRAGVEVREATALVQSGEVILAITERGAVATVYRREENLTPTLPEEPLRVNGLPLGAIARVRAASAPPPVAVAAHAAQAVQAGQAKTAAS